MLPTLAADSIDAVVCDPPYDLTDGKSGKGFMNKAWDGTGIAFDPAFWREVLRVLKPGAYVLAFGGTRTYHRMTVAIEDAGAEVRDCLMWVYGSGFPKSLDVSKAIDRTLGAEREVVGLVDPRSVYDGSCRGSTGHSNEYGTITSKGAVSVTTPATDAARQWSGWGTALKPAWEPVVVARKPLIGTVAANVQKHGTGGMNIDGCRVGTEGGTKRSEQVAYPKNADGTENRAVSWARTGHGVVELNAGRWPANIILSHAPACDDAEGCTPGCPCAAMDAQSGGDGAARFFNNLPVEADDLVPFLYAAKASRSEREEGCDALAAKPPPAAELKVSLKSPRAGAGRTRDTVLNHHPCVKPVAVMRHLVRLVTPPGGVVLDPFMGSGSTGIAAVKEGVRFIGIEMDEDYIAIARARIECALGGGFVKTDPPPMRAATLTNGNSSAMTSAPLTTRKEAPAVYVKSIKSNAKRGANVDLGARTLIVGPNGSGKSSIVNAVELALTGRASDVVGRVEVAKGIDLLALAPADADALWATALLSDGRSVEWRCERNAKTGGAREAAHTLPSDVKPVFPVRQVREALTGSPATVRAWLVGRIGATVSEAAIMGLFPEDLRSAYSDLCRPLFGTPAQILLDAREAAGKQARNANADAKAATSLAEQTGAGLGIEPTDADVEAARQRVRAAAVVASEASRPPVNVDGLRAAAEEAVALFQQRSDEAQQIRDAVAALPAVNADVVRTRDALTRVLTFTASNHASDCLICTNPIPFGAHATMLQRAEGLAAAAQGDVRGAELRTVLARLDDALPKLRDMAQRAVLAYRDAADAPAADGDPVGALTALRAAEEEVRHLEGARAAWEGVRAAQARSRDAKGRARLYSDLHDAIEEAIGRVLERACADFVKKVQSYLPTEDAFNLVLSDGGKDVCRFGFMRDGALHTALSGAEWARLTLALAAAVASDDEADIAVLTPEDRAFDPETLRAVMDGLSNAPGQVLLCSPVHPAGRTPKGWAVIDLSPAKPKRAAKATPTADAMGSISLGGTPDDDDVAPDGRFDAVGEAK